MFLLIVLLILIIISIRKSCSEKTKRRVSIICGIIGLFSIVFYAGYFILFKNNFETSIYVVTQNESDKKLSYYEVNDREYKRKTKKFEYKDNEIIILKDCFESYIVGNKVLNRKTEECRIFDSNSNEIEKYEILENIINQISELEYDIFKAKIIKVNETYYIVVELNVNLWSPYDLYRYENDKLVHLYTFDGEDVIGIKEKS